jgi:tetrahydromethanopterin S-methyltransferase subunit G
MTVEEIRQVLEGLLAPEMREIHARLDAIEEISRVRFESISQRLDHIQQSFSFDKRISDLEASKRRSAQ